MSEEYSIAFTSLEICPSSIEVISQELTIKFLNDFLNYK